MSVVPQGLLVRTLTEYDPAVAAGIGALMPEVSSRDNGEPLAGDLLVSIINSPDRDQLVAELSNRVVGAATLNLLIHGRKRKAFLDYFVVSPDVRGQGVGYELWKAIGQWCLEKDSPQLNWTSDYDRLEGHTFYLRQGAQIRKTAFFDKQFSSNEVEQG